MGERSWEILDVYLKRNTFGVYCVTLWGIFLLGKFLETLGN